MKRTDFKKLNLKAKIHLGRGLYFKKTSTTGGNWTFRYQSLGRCHEMGLGQYPYLSTSRAMAMREDFHHDIQSGVDPFEKRRTAKLFAKKRSRILFSDIAEEFISEREEQWTNPKSSQQWRYTMKTYAKPILDGKELKKITNNDIKTILQRIWFDKHETARRIQQRLRKIFGYAKVLKLYDGENPAVWQDNLEHLLPKSKDIAKKTVNPVYFKK